VKFFDRNRQQLAARGIDPVRLPPGQYFTDRFPVLHAGRVPDYRDLSTWDLAISGLVASPRSLGWAELSSLPTVDATVDIHCVTKWSKFDMAWRGVPFEDLLALAGGVLPGARHLIAHGELGQTGGGHTACPGEPIKAQFGQIVARAQQIAGQPVTPPTKQEATSMLAAGVSAIAIEATPSGKGYYVCADDGAIYAYGDAHYQGGGNQYKHNRPFTDMSPVDGGYFLLMADGGVEAFGSAVYLGGPNT